MNCEFERGFTQRYFPYKELTDKDELGKSLLIKLTLGTGLFALFYFIPVGNNYYSIFTMVYLVYLLLHIKYNTVNILYMVGYLISRTIKPTHPILELSTYFKNHTLFTDRNNFNILKQEIGNILKYRHKIPLTKNTFSGGNEYIGSGINGEQKDSEDGWRIFMISAGNIFTSGAEYNFPHLCKLVKQCPEILSCVISILPPKKGIPIHIGYYKGFLRYQIGVIIPKNKKDCFICVNGEKYIWSEGKDVLFDDTFPHKVYNNTEDIRVVIYMDIKRPYLPWYLETINNIILQLFQNSSEVQNEIKRTEYQIRLD